MTTAPASLPMRWRRFSSASTPTGRSTGSARIPDSGLSISKQIVEAHAGRMWAENRMSVPTPDEPPAVLGARFVVRLPAKLMETATATVHASAVLIGSRAMLIRGPAGSGKSRLALALIEAAASGHIRFARLVADDRVELTACSRTAAACAPRRRWRA